MTPDQAIQEAAEQKLRPVYLLVGEERHLETVAVQALRKAAVEGGIPGLNEDQLQAGEVDVDHVLAAARTLPMMARRRLVVVRGLERWEKGDESRAKAREDSKSRDPLERLLEYAKNPASSTVLILVGSGLDKRRKLVTTARSEGWLVQCEPLSRADLPLWIERTVAERGNRIARPVADLLAELVGPELGPVADAVERLCLYVGTDGTIDEDAVAECVVRLRAATVWELVGAVGRRDAGAALKALDEVYDPQDRGLRLVSVLAWSTRQLIRFESALREGLSPPEAAGKAGAPPFKARELAEQVKQTPRAELERWLVGLSDLDLGLKGGSKRSPKSQLEYAILRLCQRGEPSGMTRRA